MLTGHLDHVTGVAYHPDGQHLASSSKDGVVCLWATQLPPPREEDELLLHKAAVTQICYSPEGDRAASCSASSGDETSLTPPPLPRPPAWI